MGMHKLNDESKMTLNIVNDLYGMKISKIL